MKTKNLHFCDYIDKINRGDITTKCFVNKSVSTFNVITKIMKKKVYAIEIGLNDDSEEVEWGTDDLCMVQPIPTKDIIKSS